MAPKFKTEDVFRNPAVISLAYQGTYISPFLKADFKAKLFWNFQVQIPKKCIRSMLQNPNHLTCMKLPLVNIQWDLFTLYLPHQLIHVPLHYVIPSINSWYANPTSINCMAKYHLPCCIFHHNSWSLHSGKLTQQWKMDPEWRCISYW